MPATTLDAVNRMLTTVGLTPVTSVDTSDQSQALAMAVLTEQTTSLNRGFWSYNTRRYERLDPDPVTKKISVASDTYEGIPILGIRGNDRRGIGARNGKLMNPDAKAGAMDQWDGPVFNVEVSLNVDFTLLPAHAQDLLLARCARVYQDRVQGQSEMHGWTLADEGSEYRQFLYEENRIRRPNLTANRDYLWERN